MDSEGNVFVVNPGDRLARRLIATGLADAGLRERADLQEWIKNDPSIVAPGLLLVACEYNGWASTTHRVSDRLDLLFLDEGGSLVLCELKRDQAWDATDMQALKHAAYCNTLTPADVTLLYAQTHTVSDDDARAAIRAHASDIETAGLGPLRIRLVAGSFPASVTATVLYLREHELDIGCIEIAALRLDDQQLILTSRQIIPLPQAEQYMIGVRKREQAERAIVERSRAPNAVPVILQAGGLAPGTELRFRSEPLTSRQRELVDPWLAENADAGLAEWAGGESASRALRWKYDGKEYSASGIAVRIAQAAGVEGDLSLPGPGCWQTPEGETLWELSQKIAAGDG